jgi:hypothetical protein
MFAYELHKIRSAELIRQAEHHRLAREAQRRRRERAGAHERPAAASQGPHRGHSRFTRAA